MYMSKEFHTPDPKSNSQKTALILIQGGDGQDSLPNGLNQNVLTQTSKMGPSFLSWTGHSPIITQS